MNKAISAQRRLSTKHLGLACLGPILSFLPLVLVIEESRTAGLWLGIAMLMAFGLSFFLGRFGFIVSSLALGLALHLSNLHTLSISMLWLALSLSLLISTYSWEELSKYLAHEKVGSDSHAGLSKAAQGAADSQAVSSGHSEVMTYKSLLKVTQHTLKKQNEKNVQLQSSLTKMEKHFEDQNAQINELSNEISTLKTKLNLAKSKVSPLKPSPGSFEAKWKRALGVIARFEAQEKRLLELVSVWTKKA